MPRASLTGGLGNRLQRWALRRQGEDILPLRLAPRRIYILPSRAGWVFALLVLVMFIGGMNYGNGLALLLTFWLTGFALVAMIRTQRSLAGLRLLRATADAAFAGERLALTLEFEGALAAQDLDVSTSKDVPSTREELPSAGGLTLVQLSFPAMRRGRWRAPVLRLETRAPFGLFRSWTWLSLPVSTLVYPRPDGSQPLPEAPGGNGGSNRLAGGLDELAGLRNWREGDSPRQVAWKAYARGAPLLVREYQGHSAATREFDYSTLRIGDREARLSQLARWVVEAAARQQNWTLRLPGASALSGAGAQHRRDCLEKLALFEPVEAP